METFETDIEKELEIDCAEPYLCRACIAKGMREEYTSEQIEKAIWNRMCQGCGRHLVRADLFKIIGPHVMVEPIDKDVYSKGGIIMPATMWRLWRTAKIVQMPERREIPIIKDGKHRILVCPDVKIGDIVYFIKNATRKVEFGANRYYLVHWGDLEFSTTEDTAIMPG